MSRARQHGGGVGSGSRRGKSSKGAEDGRGNTGSGRSDSRGRRGRGRGRWQETNLGVDRNYSQEPTRLVHSPEFAFPLEQLTGHERKSSDLITLIVGGVAVSDVLIDSGATCNVVGQQPWEMLKLCVTQVGQRAFCLRRYITFTDSEILLQMVVEQTS